MKNFVNLNFCANMRIYILLSRFLFLLCSSFQESNLASNSLKASFQLIETKENIKNERIFLR